MGFRSAPLKVALSLLLASAPQLSAQSRAGMLWSNLRNSAGDVWDVWTSPFRATGTDWLTTAGVIAGAAAVSPLDASVDHWAFHNRNAWPFAPLDPLREGGVVFSGRAIAPVAVGALAVSVVAKNQRLQEGLFGCLASYGASSAVRNYVVYPLVARTRPDRREPNVVAPPARQGDQYHFSIPGSSDWGRHSFPGGHIANVFACSEFLTRRFSMGAAEPVLWAVAAGVGIGRTLDRRHWLSDQLLGAVYGYAVGKEVAIRSGRRANKAKAGRDSSVADPAQSGEPKSAWFVAPGTRGDWRLGWQRSF